MKRLAIFLNEQSLSFDDAHAADVVGHVLSAIYAIRDAKRIRNDIVVAGPAPLTSLIIGDGHSLAEILGGDSYLEEWRFLKSLDQSNPWGAYSVLALPGELQEVVFQGRPAHGMLWAKQNGSTVLSFGLSPYWGEAHIAAEFRELDYDCNLTVSAVIIPNLAKREHVVTHAELITNYGRSVAGSSLVYEGEGFVARMYFNDHNPPHFHILEKRDTSETLALYAIETLDLMSGSLPSGLRRTVEEWARNKRDDLMRNWVRCRGGSHPFRLGE